MSLAIINLYVFLRVLLAGLFIVSGIEKLIGPYQNFLFVVQSYDLLPIWTEEIVARVFPWIEFFLGIFVLLGLWLPGALRGLLVLVTIFLIVVGQAMIRRLPIDECGCFGELISIPLPGVIAFDSFLFLLTFVLLRRFSQTAQFSLDQFFAKRHA